MACARLSSHMAPCRHGDAGPPRLHAHPPPCVFDANAARFAEATSHLTVGPVTEAIVRAGVRWEIEENNELANAVTGIVHRVTELRAVVSSDD